MFYISADSHLAWLKIALQCGQGHDTARLIAVDTAGKMDTDRLRTAVLEDQASGLLPFMVVGTAGTTNAGVIDPLQAFWPGDKPWPAVFSYYIVSRKETLHRPEVRAFTEWLLNEARNGDMEYVGQGEVNL